jgi:hypothetical protein
VQIHGYTVPRQRRAQFHDAPRQLTEPGDLVVVPRYPVTPGSDGISDRNQPNVINCQIDDRQPGRQLSAATSNREQYQRLEFSSHVGHR